MNNKKWFRHEITFVLLLILIGLVLACASTSSPWDFVIREYVLIKYKGNATEVIIPKSLGIKKYMNMHLVNAAA